MIGNNRRGREMQICTGSQNLEPSNGRFAVFCLKLASENTMQMMPPGHEKCGALRRPYLPKLDMVGVNNRPESRTRFHAPGSRLAFSWGNALKEARRSALVMCVAELELALTLFGAK
jgi:hypothetical protein